ALGGEVECWKLLWPHPSEDMVYADLLDLGVTDRPEEDRVENSPHPHCASCWALVGGAYFYRGFKCPTCEEARPFTGSGEGLSDFSVFPEIPDRIGG
ncbi:hypothetical protein AK812_SmicGene46443, partial [Symbiodinium microadriaticum]